MGVILREVDLGSPIGYFEPDATDVLRVSELCTAEKKLI